MRRMVSRGLSLGLIAAVTIAAGVARSGAAVRPMKLRRSQNFNLFVVREDMQRWSITDQHLTDILKWLEKGLQVYTGELGFREPVGQFWRGRIPVKLHDFAMEEGPIIKAAGYVTGAEGVIHLSAREVFGTNYFAARQPFASLATTAVHELFHLVQHSYDLYEESWISEATARWAEAQVFPHSRSPIFAEHQYLKHSQYALHFTERDAAGELLLEKGRPYGSSIFIRFLSREDQAGRDVVRRIWEHCAAREGPNAIQALTRAADGGAAPPAEAEQRSGSVIASVARNGPAFVAGLQAGDEILSIDGMVVTSNAHVIKLAANRKPKHPATIRFRRGKRLCATRLIVGARKDPATGNERPWLGVTFKPAPSPARLKWDDVRHRPRPSVFNAAKPPLQPQRIYSYMQDFAAAIALIESAPPDRCLDDLDAFLGGTPAPGTAGALGRLDPNRHRAVCSDLSASWTAYQAAFVEPEHAAYIIDPAGANRGYFDGLASVAGLGTRYLVVSKPPWLARDTPLQVEVMADERELRLQGFADPGGEGPWQVRRALPISDRGVHRLTIPRFDQTASPVWIAVSRFADDPDWNERKIFPMAISAVTVPVVAEVELEQGGDIVFTESWEADSNPDGIVTGRKHWRREKPVDPRGAPCNLSVEFSQPVKASGGNPICELDGTAVPMQPAPGNPLVYGCTLQPAQLAARPAGHELTIRAHADFPGAKAQFPLDEDPLTIARLEWDEWKQYEDRAGKVVVKFGEATAASPAFSLKFHGTNGAGGRFDLILRAELEIDGWQHLPLKATDYAAINEGVRYADSRIWWLFRFDYGARTFYAPVYTLEGSLEDKASTYVDIPVDRVGEIPIHVTVYTGGQGKPVFSFDTVMQVPDTGSRGTKETAAERQERIALEKTVDEHWAQHIRGGLTEDIRRQALAVWIEAEADRVQDEIAEIGHGYLFANHDALVARIEARLNQRQGSYFPRQGNHAGMRLPTCLNTSIWTKAGILWAVFAFDELDAFLRELQLDYQNADKAMRQRPDEGIWSKLAKFYARYLLDHEHASWLLERYQAMGGDPKLVGHIREDIEAAKRLRAHFPPEAFGGG